MLSVAQITADDCPGRREPTFFSISSIFTTAVPSLSWPVTTRRILMLIRNPLCCGRPRPVLSRRSLQGPAKVSQSAGTHARPAAAGVWLRRTAFGMLQHGLGGALGRNKNAE